MARRIVDYLEMSPVERMLAGEAAPKLSYRPAVMHNPETDPPPF